jgi:putative tryptophan/tyrosine transport system substrate-binding protein
MLHELMPSVTVVAVLVNPDNSEYTEYEMNEVRNAAGSLGPQLNVFNASTVVEIDSICESGAGSSRRTLISSETFFTSRREQLVALAARHRVPTMYPLSVFTTAGGMISYSFNLADNYRQIGVYIGRILKGEKPADLPRKPQKWSCLSTPRLPRLRQLQPARRKHHRRDAIRIRFGQSGWICY